MDPITAMAAVNKAVSLIKQASSTVDNVASLGPLIGKYFDAKHTAVKAVKENKKSGGSNMAKAIEIELALKAQRDFEEQLKGLFFSSNNMDVWNSIMQRVAEMNREDAQEAAREKDRAKNAKRRQSEIAEISLALGLIIVLFIFATWGLVEFINYCGSNACGK
jgi:ActR/RegA family two-component response regulator